MTREERLSAQEICRALLQASGPQSFTEISYEMLIQAKNCNTRQEANDYTRYALGHLLRQEALLISEAPNGHPSYDVRGYLKYQCYNIDSNRIISDESSPNPAYQSSHQANFKPDPGGLRYPPLRAANRTEPSQLL